VKKVQLARKKIRRRQSEDIVENSDLTLSRPKKGRTPREFSSKKTDLTAARQRQQNRSNNLRLLPLRCLWGAVSNSPSASKMVRKRGGQGVSIVRYSHKQRGKGYNKSRKQFQPAKTLRRGNDLEGEKVYKEKELGRVFSQREANRTGNLILISSSREEGGKGELGVANGAVAPPGLKGG